MSNATIPCSYAVSAAEGVASSGGHVLAERGEVGYNLWLAEVWPAFGSHSQEAVTLRHVLSHTARVPGMPADTTVTDLCNWQPNTAAPGNPDRSRGPSRRHHHSAARGT